MPGRTYSLQFKREAVALAEQNGVPQSAAELGLKDNILYRWRREIKLADAKAFGEKSTAPQNDTELTRLRREVSHLKEERDVLKKALAIFTQKK